MYITGTSSSRQRYLSTSASDLAVINFRLTNWLAPLNEKITIQYPVPDIASATRKQTPCW